MEGRVRAGIPWRRSRRAAALADLADALKDPDVLTRVDAVGRFWEVASEESRLAGAIALSDEPVTLANGREPDAYVVHVGLVAEFFVTEDGRDVGQATFDADAPWARDLSGGDRRALLRALEVLRGRRAPELTVLPFHRPAPVGPGGSGR